MINKFKIISKNIDIHQKSGVYFKNQMKFLKLTNTITNIKNVKYKFNRRLEQGK